MLIICTLCQLYAHYKKVTIQNILRNVTFLKRIIQNILQNDIFNFKHIGKKSSKIILVLVGKESRHIGKEITKIILVLVSKESRKISEVTKLGRLCLLLTGKFVWFMQL